MQYCERIKKNLKETFHPISLQVIDESALHAGHVGAKPEGETHFRVKLQSKFFVGKTRLECQRAVYKALKAELEERVHALALELSPPKTD
jgi:BolA protein